MKYKNTYTIAFFLWMAAVTGSCTDQFDNADQADKIEKMTIIVQADVNVSGLPAPEYLKVQLNNYSEKLKFPALSPCYIASVSMEKLLRRMVRTII